MSIKKKINIALYFYNLGCFFQSQRKWEQSINLFNTFRKSDLNIKQAISSKAEEVDLYFYHNKSPLNTLDKNVSDKQNAKVQKIKKIDIKNFVIIISLGVGSN